MVVSALSSAGGGRTDRVVTLSQIKDEELGMNSQAAFVSVMATITYIRNENMSYPACSNDSTTNPGRKCAKKLIDNGDDTWHCEKCQRNSIVDWRYILSVTANDHTGNSWLTLFNESAIELLNGTTAAQLKEMESNGDPNFEAILQVHI
jgi:replication factor A1